MSEDHVKQLEDLTSEQPKNPLRPRQVEAYQDEMQRLEGMVNAPPYVPADRAKAAKRYSELKRTIEREAPKPVEEAGRRNMVYEKAKQVRDQVIKPSMLSRSVMRRNPPGAVETFMERENSPYVKRGILAFKRAMLGLNPHDTKPLNMELIRPEGGGESTASFMADAQIPGGFTMSEQAKANWPLGEPTSKTATAHLDVPEEIKQPRKSDQPVAMIVCESGCGREFPSKSRGTPQKYCSKECRDRDYKKKRQTRMEE